MREQLAAVLTAALVVLPLAGCGSGSADTAPGAGSGAGGGHVPVTSRTPGSSTGEPTPGVTGSGSGIGGLVSLDPGAIGGGTAGGAATRGGGTTGGASSGSGSRASVPTALTPEQEAASHSCGVNRGEGGREMEFWYVVNAATGSYWGCDLTITALTDYYQARPTWKPGSTALSVDGFACNHVPEQNSYIQVICVRDGDLIYSSWLP